MAISKKINEFLEIVNETFNEYTLKIQPMVISTICGIILGKIEFDISEESLTKIKELLDEHKFSVAESYSTINAFLKAYSPSIIENNLLSRARIDFNREFDNKEDEANLEDFIEYILNHQSPKLLLFNQVVNNKTELPADNISSKAIDDVQAIAEKFKNFGKPSNNENEYDEHEPESNNNQQAKEDIEANNDIPAKEKMEMLVTETKKLQKELTSEIFGQEHAISTFVSGYFSSELAIISQPKHRQPRATFLFAGPPGVGKTFLAEKAASILNLPFERFDMSEFSIADTSKIEFCGISKSYKDHKPGRVTGFVKKHPKSVLLFDEIEKAHPTIIQLFLQLLDAGRLRDEEYDEEIDFKDTIIMFTTNAGANLYNESKTKDLSGISKNVIIDALKNDINPLTQQPFFPAAICSRFASGNVVMFNHIGVNNLLRITKSSINKRVSNIQANADIDIDIDESLYTALLFSVGANADARSMTARAGKFIEDEIYELLSLVNSSKTTATVKKLEGIKIVVDTPKSEEIKKLFNNETDQNVLVFADEAIVDKCQKATKISNIIGAQSIEQAKKLLADNTIRFVIVDMTYGAYNKELSYLYVGDENTLSKDFVANIKEFKPQLPIYILENEAMDFTDEEEFRFTSSGIRDIIDMADDDFGKQIDQICISINQQQNLEFLTKSNQVISFGTGQSICTKTNIATISLIDFELKTNYKPQDINKVMSNVERPKVTFKDVTGAKSAKEELQFFVEYLKDPNRFKEFGLKPPRGVLLYGPPGTGKTLLAKAMANESGVTFIATEANRFMDKYIGEGEKKVHELFESAREYAPAIIFIDEFELIAKERQGGEHAAANGEDVLTALLTELDGFNVDSNRPVFLLAATNFDVTPGSSKSLDSAILRRFDKLILVDLPDKEDRKTFLKTKIQGSKIFDQVSEAEIDNLASRSTGLSLAILENIIESALRNAAKKGDFTITDADLEEAFESERNGDKKSWSDDVTLKTARHEAGHALICWLTGEKPSYLTVASRGNFGGYMQHENDENRFGYNKNELLGLIRTSLAGRAAELVYYGNDAGTSTGPSSDIRNATKVAQSLLCDYGMDDEFGLAYISKEEMLHGEIAKDIRRKVNDILKAELQNAIDTINKNKKAIDALVNALLEKTSLNKEQIDQIISENIDK